MYYIIPVKIAVLKNTNVHDLVTHKGHEVLVLRELMCNSLG